MNKIKRTLLIIIASFGFALTFTAITPQQLIAQTPKDAACEGVRLTGGSCGGNAEGQVSGILATVIDIFSLIVGVAAVIMIVVGGLRYITSGGDANSTKGAKDTIIYAIIGLVIVALAQVIVRFVLSNV